MCKFLSCFWNKPQLFWTQLQLHMSHRMILKCHSKKTLLEKKIQKNTVVILSRASIACLPSEAPPPGSKPEQRQLTAAVSPCRPGVRRLPAAVVPPAEGLADRRDQLRLQGRLLGGQGEAGLERLSWHLLRQEVTLDRHWPQHTGPGPASGHSWLMMSAARTVQEGRVHPPLRWNEMCALFFYLLFFIFFFCFFCSLFWSRSSESTCWRVQVLDGHLRPLSTSGALLILPTVHFFIFTLFKSFCHWWEKNNIDAADSLRPSDEFKLDPEPL